LLSQYEVVALGLGYNIDQPVPVSKIPKLIESIWSNTKYTDWAGSGITATTQIATADSAWAETFQE